MLRAPHFKDLVCCTIATLLNYSGKSAFELKKYREKWGLGGEKDTIVIITILMVIVPLWRELHSILWFLRKETKPELQEQIR